MKTKAFLPALILATLFTSLNRSEKNHFTLFDFTNGADISQWYVLNDDVMGGISTSELIINEDGHGAFSGTVSTENYGGFASIRYQMGRTNTRKASHIRFRIKGDGKDYQIRIKPNSSDMHSYIKSFSTNSKWETITIKLNDLYPSFRGRKC